MAAKARLTIFAVAVITPIFIACINLKAFWIATALLMVYFSVTSLKELIIANFASDEFYFRYMKGKSHSESEMFILTDAILICGAYALIITMLFMSLFMFDSSVMKIGAAILLILWIFDFKKVFSKPSDDEDWSIVDTVKEIVMWTQGIVSVVFAASALLIL